MGTRSLLGYEQKDGRIYAQYMQFDGTPIWRGREFYEGCVVSIKETSRFVHTQGEDEISGNPTEDWFTRVQNFLNNYQYLSGHSINSNFTVSKKEWFSKRNLSDSEWRYLFDINGDFTIYRPGRFTATIPWAFTTKMMKVAGDEFWKKINGNKSPFEDYWEALDKYEELLEHKRIASWEPKKALLHLNDEFEYTSTKDILAQVLKGDHVKVPVPVLWLETEEVHAFPKQGPDGWRGAGHIKFNEKKVLKSSIKWTGRKRNKKTLTTLIERS